MTLLTLLQSSGATPPPIVVIETHPRGDGGDGDDGFFAEAVRRPNYKPVPEKQKQPYIEVLKDVSRDKPPDKAPKRKQFKEPEARQPDPPQPKRLEPKFAPRFTPDVTPVVVSPVLEAQRVQAAADKQREVQEAALEMKRLADAHSVLQQQIETERGLLAQQLQRQAIEQDDEEAMIAMLLLTK